MGKGELESRCQLSLESDRIVSSSIPAIVTNPNTFMLCAIIK